MRGWILHSTEFSRWPTYCLSGQYLAVEYHTEVFDTWPVDGDATFSAEKPTGHVVICVSPTVTVSGPLATLPEFLQTGTLASPVRPSTISCASAAGSSVSVVRALFHQNVSNCNWCRDE